MDSLTVIVGMCNWLREHNYVDNMVYFMTDAEIIALYEFHSSRANSCCEG